MLLPLAVLKENHKRECMEEFHIVRKMLFQAETYQPRNGEINVSQPSPNPFALKAYFQHKRCLLLKYFPA